MTGDEAYQRRLALSRGFQPPVTIANTSSTPSGSAQALPDTEVFSLSIRHDVEDTLEVPPSPPRAVLPVHETGEEAYLRRLALSQSRQLPSVVSAPLGPAPVSIVPDEPPALAYNPFASPAVPPPPPSVPPGLSEDKVRSSREAAAAIAAKLAALAPPPGSTSEPSGEGSTSPPGQDDNAPTKRLVTYNF